MIDFFYPSCHLSSMDLAYSGRSNGSGGHFMSLNIKNKDVERLIKEVSLLTGESKTEAVRRSLEERRERLAYQGAANDRGDCADS